MLTDADLQCSPVVRPELGSAVQHGLGLHSSRTVPAWQAAYGSSLHADAAWVPPERNWMPLGGPVAPTLIHVTQAPPAPT